MTTKGKHWARLTGRLSLNLEPSVLAALERLAAERGQSTGHIAREAITAYLAATSQPAQRGEASI